MQNILVVYASPHGSTAEIAVFMGRLLQAYDVSVTVKHADHVVSVDAYDVCLLGSAIHSSMWLPSLSRFMFRFAEALAQKPVYLFLVCIIALEEGGVERATRDFVWQEALDALNIPQERIHAFAGKLNWERITGDETWVIKQTYRGEQLDSIDSGDYRDWAAIAQWTHSVAAALALAPAVDTDTPARSSDISRTTKDETITKEGVAQLSWLDNPGEVAPI